MHSPFWTNTIWYVLLGITSAISLLIAWKRSVRPKFLLAFTAAMLGFTYHIEAILILWFKAYTYYPKIVADPFQDAVLGNVFSQVSISTTAALIIAYHLSYLWSFLFAGIYLVIEEYFLLLGIYVHYWYKSFITTIGIITLFFLFKKWYDRLLYRPRLFIQYLTIYFGSFALYANLAIMPLKLSKIQIFRGNIFSELSKNHTLIAMLYGFILIHILILLYQSKLRIAWKGVVFSGLVVAQYVLFQCGVIYIKDGLFIWVTLIDLFACYGSIALIDRWLHSKRCT